MEQLKSRPQSAGVWLPSHWISDGGTEPIPRPCDFPRTAFSAQHTQWVCWAGLKGLLRRWLHPIFWPKKQRESKASTKKEPAAEEQWSFYQQAKYHIIKSRAKVSSSVTTQTFIDISKLSSKRSEVIGNWGYCFTLLVLSLMISARNL